MLAACVRAVPHCRLQPLTAACVQGDALRVRLWGTSFEEADYLNLNLELPVLPDRHNLPGLGSIAAAAAAELAPAILKHGLHQHYLIIRLVHVVPGNLPQVAARRCCAWVTVLDCGWRSQSM